METYLVLSLAVGAGAVVFLVNLFKKKVTSELGLVLTIIIASGLIALVVILSLWRYANIVSVGGATGVIYVFSQIFYQVEKVISKWLTQKEQVTPQEVITDGEQVAGEIEKDVQQEQTSATAA